MNEQSDMPKCSRCGGIVTANAPDGLCPRCLIALNFITQTELLGEEANRFTSAPAPPAPAPQELARHFPQLEILELLGRGGMGVVYKARQPKLDRFVALKILLRPHQDGKDDAAFTERFAREARALARLNHPNIVAVHDYGEADGYPFLLMEYVEGVTLRQLLHGGKLAPAEALTIIPKICEALQFAHQKGIVHRDIKPENILIDKAGQVKITDFGIAKVVSPEGLDRSLTGVKDVVGTPHYMAPEQIEEPAKVDHRADIYSLGVVFYEMLTGELPLGKFQPPSNKVQLDIRLDEVVLRALAKEPERRYQEARQVKTALETITTTDPSRHKTPELHAASLLHIRRLRRAPVGILAVLLFLAVAAGALLMWLQRPQQLDTTVGMDSPDGKSTALASTWRAMRVFGGDVFTYRFSIRGMRSTSHKTWEVPVPVRELTEGRVTGPLEYYLFEKHGHIQWSKDSARVSFVVGRTEVSALNLLTGSHSSQEGFLPVRQITLKGTHLPDFFLDLDDGRTPILPRELIASSRTASLSGNSPLADWMRTNGLDLTRRSNAISLILLDGFTVIMAEKSGPSARPRAFDSLSTTQVLAAVETAAGVLPSPSGSGYIYNLDARAVWAFKTREGAVGLLEMVQEDQKSGLTCFRFKLVDPALQKPPSFSFGPVIERVVNDPDWAKTGSCLDLDTGELADWLRQKGVDLMSDSSGKSIQVFDLGYVALQNEQFETLQPAQLAELVRQANASIKPVETITTINPPSTFAFKTVEGALGILQITGFTDDLRAVILRYKLLQQSNTPPSEAATTLSGVAQATQAVVEQQVATKLFAMKARLSLTHEQENRVRELLQRKFRLAGELSTSMTEGLLSQDAMDKANRSVQEMDREFKKLLTRPQMEDYEAWQVEERRTQAQLAANVEILQLQAVLQLSQTQRDQVLELLTRLHEQQLAGSLQGLKIPVDWEAQLAAIKDTLQPVLNEGQLQILDKWLELQRETIKTMLSKPEKP